MMQAVNQSVLEPAGPLAARIAGEFWFAVAAATIMYLLTLAALGYATWSARRRAPADTTRLQDDAGTERRQTRAVTIGAAITVAVLLVFLVVDLAVGRSISPAPRKDPLIISLTGYQWWWLVEYPDSTPQKRISTANEIHVPVGEPVVLLLSSRDVIHSVWVPNLAGKKDLVPGYTQSAWFQADTAGVYRGQCAEFCGHQHAKMGLVVIAEPRAQFEAWQANARQPASPPVDALARRGETVFMTGTCAMCHAIAGTSAGSRVGPDLTGIGGRRTIAAASLPNTPENLARWIRDPHAIKPGTRMPPSDLTDAELSALVAYLQGLR